MPSNPHRFPVAAGLTALILADGPLAASLEASLGRIFDQPLRVGDFSDALRVLETTPCDLVIADVLLLPARAEEGVRALRRGADSPGLILISHPVDPALAYRLTDAGVDDVLSRAPHAMELELRVRRLLEKRDLGAHLASLEDAISERSRHSYQARSMVARSRSMRELGETIDRVARMRTTVLVTGESGVGKELVSRSLHFRSPRAGGPFIAINCAALPPHLIESELFGHERGAFTGAVSRRAGKFELAHSGTLFLDEVGETDLSTQAKLLRVLESREFMRVGGSRPLTVDVRLVAATNADLERMVREGRFREDLFYRLKVIAIEVPPLRERVEDIPELVQATLDQLTRANHLRPRRVTAEAMERLCRYPWPGNVRELINTLEALVVGCPSELIGEEHLPVALRGGDTGALNGASPAGLAGRSLKEIESEAIRLTLSATGGSRTRAAELLGIGLRTLRRRIKSLGLDESIPPRPGRPPRG